MDEKNLTLKWPHWDLPAQKLKAQSKEKLLQWCWRECRSVAANNTENTEHTSKRHIFGNHFQNTQPSRPHSQRYLLQPQWWDAVDRSGGCNTFPIETLRLNIVDDFKWSKVMKNKKKLTKEKLEDVKETEAKPKNLHFTMTYWKISHGGFLTWHLITLTFYRRTPYRLPRG